MFWTLYFNGSRSNDGAGARCILISPDGEITMLACRLDFECTNIVVEYKTIVQDLYKEISLDFQYLQVFGDS